MVVSSADIGRCMHSEARAAIKKQGGCARIKITEVREGSKHDSKMQEGENIKMVVHEEKKRWTWRCRDKKRECAVKKKKAWHMEPNDLNLTAQRSKTQASFLSLSTPPRCHWPPTISTPLPSLPRRTTARSSPATPIDAGDTPTIFFRNARNPFSLARSKPRLHRSPSRPQGSACRRSPQVAVSGSSRRRRPRRNHSSPNPWSSASVREEGAQDSAARHHRASHHVWTRDRRDHTLQIKAPTRRRQCRRRCLLFSVSLFRLKVAVWHWNWWFLGSSWWWSWSVRSRCKCTSCTSSMPMTVLSSRNLLCSVLPPFLSHFVLFLCSHRVCFSDTFFSCV